MKTVLSESMVWNFDQQVLILRQDRADGDLGAVLGRPGADVLDGVGADGQLGQLFLGGVLVIQHHAGIQREQSSPGRPSAD